MAYHAADTLIPKGRLNPAALWPGVDGNVVRENLEQYLAEGYSKTADDEAARTWAYYRAYQEVYERLLLTPSTVSINDEGSASYLLTQMEHVGQLADAALAEFEGLAAETGSDFGVITSLR